LLLYYLVLLFLFIQTHHINYSKSKEKLPFWEEYFVIIVAILYLNIFNYFKTFWVLSIIQLYYLNYHCMKFYYFYYQHSSFILFNLYKRFDCVGDDRLWSLYWESVVEEKYLIDDFLRKWLQLRRSLFECGEEDRL
jgi:hypothetical protein